MKIGYDTVSTKTSVDPRGISDSRIILQICPVCNEVCITFVDHSFDPGFLRKEMILGDVAYVSQDNCKEG